MKIYFFVLSGKTISLFFRILKSYRTICSMMELINKITILDGGTGFQLNLISDSSIWGSQMLQSDPDKVKLVHENFVKAGAQILYSNTYSLHLKSDDDEEKKYISNLLKVGYLYSNFLVNLLFRRISRSLMILFILILV